MLDFPEVTNEMQSYVFERLKAEEKVLCSQKVYGVHVDRSGMRRDFRSRFGLGKFVQTIDALTADGKIVRKDVYSIGMILFTPETFSVVQPSSEELVKIHRPRK